MTRGSTVLMKLVSYAVCGVAVYAMSIVGGMCMNFLTFLDEDFRFVPFAVVAAVICCVILFRFSANQAVVDMKDSCYSPLNNLAVFFAVFAACTFLLKFFFLTELEITPGILVSAVVFIVPVAVFDTCGYLRGKKLYYVLFPEYADSSEKGYKPSDERPSGHSWRDSV